MLWKPLRDLISYYYLNAPLRLGGWEGSEHMDICASLTSLPSSHWIGDIRRLECEQRINRAVDSWTTALLFAILTLVVTSTLWNFPTLLYRAWVFLITPTTKVLKNTGKRVNVNQELTNARTRRTTALHDLAKVSHAILQRFIENTRENATHNPRTYETEVVALYIEVSGANYQQKLETYNTTEQRVQQLEGDPQPPQPRAMNLRNRVVPLLQLPEDPEPNQDVDEGD
jgi:hypothetical protein